MQNKSEPHEQTSSPGSSSNSKQYARSKGKGGSRAAPAARDLDHGLKLLAASALSASGYFTRINVALSATGDRGFSDVTDVDVLALRYDPLFTARRVAMSCKAGERVGVAHEIFYIRGVLEYLDGDEGVLLLGAKKADPHLRDLADRLNILVAWGPETDAWTKSIAKDAPEAGYFDATRYNDWAADLAGVVPGNALIPYLRSDYWFYRDFRNVQNVLQHFKRLEHRLDGRSRGHSVLFYEVAAHLTLSLLDLCRHVVRMGPGRVQEVLPSYLFGGNASYKARRDLHQRVNQLLQATGTITPNGPSLPPLDPAYTPELAELVIRFVERPQAAIKVPLVLQDATWRLFGAPGSPAFGDTVGLVAQKLTSDLLTFIKNAAGHPWAPSI